MPYQVDVWGGDLHQQHFGAGVFTDWAAAAAFMAPLIDGGLLCNILRTDFQTSPDRLAEAEADLARTTRQPDTDQ